MPVNLNQFLRVAANRTTSEIYVDGPAHQTRAQNRGSFRSWLVSVFQSDTARNQRTETAHAFIAALQEKVSAKTSTLGGADPEVIDQYSEDTAQIVESLKRLLADQLNGRKALTANDIHRANEFVDSTLEIADQEKDKLTANLSRQEAITSLESAAERFYGAETVSEVRMASKGIRVAHRTAHVPGLQLPAQSLRAYLTGNPPALSFEEKSALLAQVRSDINRTEDITAIAIPTFERLSRGEVLEANNWTTDVDPGSEEARLLLNTFQTLQHAYLGPLNVLEYFLKADVAEGLRERFLDAKELPLGNGGTATSERPLREILDDFQAGKQLSEPDVAFARSALGSRALTQINQMTPGYLLFSGGGNPRVLMTKAVEAAQQVPSHVWQVLTDKRTPNWKAEASNNPQDKEIVYSPSERNPWGLAVSQKLIDRGSEVQDFSGAMRGLTELLNDLVGSNGNLDVARQRKEAAEPAPKSKHSWSSRTAAINQATLRNAQEVNQREKEAFPNLFERGPNRSLTIDPEATPSRTMQKSGRDYTHGYDDDIDAGRVEASRPQDPPNRPTPTPGADGEAPRRGILKSTAGPSDQPSNSDK